jgi:hypothetical protein
LGIGIAQQIPGEADSLKQSIRILPRGYLSPLVAGQRADRNQALAKLQLGRISEESNSPIRIRHPRQLHEQAVLAADLYQRLSHPQPVDPLLDDSLYPLHHFGGDLRHLLGGHGL